MLKINKFSDDKEIKSVIYNNDNFVDRIKSIQLSLLSTEEIKNLSFGEVKTPETIHYKTHIPVEGGLYCQKIFGPLKNWACACGKYTGKIFKNVICNECGVKIDSSNVRRERIGHIELSTPVLHSWYYLGSYNNYLSTILDCDNRNIAEIIHFEKFILPDVNFNENYKISLIGKNNLDNLDDNDKDRVLYGTEGISEILNSLDLEKLLNYITTKVKKKETKRINFLKHLIEQKTDVKKIIIKLLPILPCDLRPIIPLNNGVLGTTDINHLYRLVILRNNRIKTLMAIRVPEIILRHSKVILQKAIDALFDNNRLKKPFKPKERSLKSIASELSGKQGILRANLLGKRVDFSARSVIVIDPTLKISECSLPIEMATELFKLEISRKLLQTNNLLTLNEAIDEVENLTPRVIKILRSIIKNRSILLNRAPTLHRNSLQAFNIKLTEGRAIKIHPLICEGFNADCDGDLMAVYLSILPSTILENKILMDVTNNIFSFANGHTIVKPVREILMGCYYTTLDLEKAKKHEGIIKNIQDVLKLYENNIIDIHDKIEVVINKKLVYTTTGRVLANECLPEEFRNYEVVFGKKFIEKFTVDISSKLGNEKTTQVLDKIKDFGFHYSTKYALTLSLEDMITPKEKEEKILETTGRSLEMNNLREKNLLTYEEIRNHNIKNWSSTIENLKESMTKESKKNPLNDLFISINSGARGSIEQPRQLSIMRGMVADTTGKVIDYPVTSSYKNGLNPIEYFISSSGSRKGAADRALKTASAGYLTRKLVVLASGVFISERDCKSKEGITYDDILDESGDLVINKYDRLFGRTLLKSVLHLKAGKILEQEDIEILKENKICPEIRSVLTCKSKNVCSLCYGMDLARKCEIAAGTPVGIIAAQSIGEPALQLTMRTFHTGGATLSDKDESIVIAKESGLVEKINADIIEISLNKDSFYKYMVRHSGHILINMDGRSEKLPVNTGDLLHFNENQEFKKNDILYTKNLKAEIFFAEKKGKLKIIEGKLTRINNENVLSSNSSKIIVSIDKQEIFLPKQSILFFQEGDIVNKGDIIAKRVHTSNVSQDIVDSLKQIEHIIEMRKTKDISVQSAHEGKFDYDLIDDQTIHPYVTDKNNEKKSINNKNCSLESLVVEKGEYITKGQKITFGLIDYNKILNVLSVMDAMVFMLNEVKEKYVQRDISIDDKHIEIIIKKMFGFGLITESNSYKFTSGNIYPLETIQEYNETAEEKVKFLVKCLSITKSCLNSKSFISATSFQNTRNLLAEAAFFNKKDNLTGIEENMLVGNPIPAGTGMKENIDNVYTKLTKKDAELSLSLFLKKVNPFYFVNTCLEELDKENQENTNFIENQENWLTEIMQKTKKKIVEDRL